jgi:cell division septation protein DedD
MGNATAAAAAPDAAPVAPAPAARPRATEAPARAAAPRAGGGNAPLAIVPVAQGAAPPAEPPRSRAARTEAPSAPVATAPAAAPSAGGYAVQVSSQRTEAEAQSAFKSLQAKFPGQLGNRQPIIHRADLGDKGTYYRAMVGPFGSSEAASAMCSNLKAAGGSCIVQKN